MTITNRSRESRVETIASRYKEILETSRVIGAEGYRFEISEVNRNQTKAALLHASTYRSSIPTSAGNVAELAHRHGSQHTVYVSSFGRGRTSPLENPELRFLAKHGSLLTATDGEAITLPVARALLIALENEGIRICGVRYFNELTNFTLLTEEVGELARYMSRVYGEQSFKKGEEQHLVKQKIEDEMADILFVLCCLANQMDIDLDEAMERNILKKTKRDLHRHEQNEKLKK